jgi:hypothetical protein
MALDIKIGIQNEKAKMVIYDLTGEYNAVTNPTGWITATAKSVSSASTVADTMTVPSHGFYTGQQVTYTFGGTGAFAASSGDEVYVTVIDPNTIKLSYSATLLPFVDINNATLVSNTFTPYNDVRARISAISLSITQPGTTTPLSAINLYTTTFWTSIDYAYNLTSSVTLTDGIWKFVVTFTNDGSPVIETVYALRTNDLTCTLSQLALGNMTSNDYAEIKLMYDKMVNAFECGEYDLAQEIYDDIQDALTECYPSIKPCGC